jgi:hypothetical protein
MLKNISKLECKIGEKSYQLLCEMDSPTGDVKQALFEFLKYVGQVEDAIKASQKVVQENSKNQESESKKENE